MREDRKTRLKWLDRRLSEGALVTSEIYMREFNVSLRTFGNDIKELKDLVEHSLNIKIKNYDGKYKYSRVGESYYKENDENIEYTVQKEEKIKKALNILSDIIDIKGFEDINDQIQDLCKLLKYKTTDRKIILFENNFDSINYYSEELISKMLLSIYEYIKNRYCIKITYSSFKIEESKEYLFSPHILKQYNNRWFLFGMDNKNKVLRHFPLDRIIKIEITQEAYLECDIDFNDYFDDILGVSNNENLEIQKIEIELDDSIIPYLETKPIHSSQKIKENNILSFQVKLNYELESIILSYGEKMKVLKPLELSERIKERLKKSISLYT